MEPVLLSSVLTPAFTLAADTATASGAALPVEPLTAVLIGCLFVINIIALGYLLGGQLLCTLIELRSKRHPALGIVAKAINTSVINFHPLTIVFVITPLVIANGFYFLYLFSIKAPALGTWGMMIPIAGLWLMLTCMHRYSWPVDNHRVGFDGSHAFVGVLSTMLAAVLPLIYLLWISPMAEPASMGLATVVSSVLPRWVHLLLMCTAGTSLLLAWRLGSADGPLASLGQMVLAQVRRKLLRTSLFALVFQFVVAVPVLMTMHYEFMSVLMGVFLALGMVASVITMVMLAAEINAASQRVGRFLPHATTLLLVAVLAMAMTRQAYQAKAAAPGADEALKLAKSELEPNDSPEILAMPGRQLFITHCNVCHSTPSLAPPLREIESIYRNDPDAIVRWAQQPGRKRAKYGPMPPMSHLRPRTLKLIAEYMLASGKPKETQKPITTANPDAAASTGSTSSTDAAATTDNAAPSTPQ